MPAEMQILRQWRGKMAKALIARCQGNDLI